MVEQVKTKTEPYVRFRGFTDEWEEVKLGDVSSISTGKLNANVMDENGVYDFYTSGVQKYKTNTYSFEGPAITIAGNGATVGYMHYADGKFDAYQRTYVLEDFLADRSFIYSNISRVLPRKIQREARMGNIPYIVMSMLTDLKFGSPSLPEQQALGELFQTLDKTIDLSNTQVENMKQQKKALLQRLFPQKGETEPKVRLRGFKDDWDSSLLLDEIEVYQPKSLPQSKFLAEGYPVYGANGMIGYYDEYNHENRQIAMACRGNTAGVVNIIPEQSYITGNAMIMDVYTNNKLDFNFMGQLFNNFDFTPYISGSGQPQITRSALKGAYIQLPSLEEQQAIGELFQTLDEQIRLAEDKVSQYKELKQALLQRLFV